MPTLCLDLARVCPYDSTFLSDGEDTPTARATFLSEEFMEVFDYKSMMSAGRGKVTACLKALAVSFPEVAAPAVMQLVSEVEAVRRSPPAVAQPYSLTTQSYNDANGKLLAMDALCAPLQTLLSTSLNVELKGFVFQTLSKAVEALLM